MEKMHTIKASPERISVETKVKRGGCTRDQDEIKVKVKGGDAAKVVEKLNNTIEILQETSDPTVSDKLEGDD